jgi:hypothetical protein
MLEMNKITRKKNQDYTVMSNVFLKDRNLSIKAKGFLAVVMGLPEDWEFSINGLCSILKEGKTAIYNVIDELKGYGYCNVVMCRDELGRISGSDYTFFEEPQIELPQTDKPYTENPDTVKPDMDNTTQLNTYSIKDTTNKVLKESKDESLQKKFNFKQALLDLGVCENVANDFLLVRKNKKATNSETSFKRLKTEIAQSGLSANDCITIAVENDWKGFKVEWIQKQNRKHSIEGFSSYSPKNVSGRAGVYMNTLTVPVQIEKNGIKYLSDGTYVESGKRYYTHRIRGKVEVSMGAVARPNEDWEWNSSTLTWEQDERTITISDMLF